LIDWLIEATKTVYIIYQQISKVLIGAKLLYKSEMLVMVYIFIPAIVNINPILMKSVSDKEQTATL